MRRICVGIHAYEQPEQLQATLESVRRNTPSAVRIILLPDGPDAGMRQALRSFSDTPQLGTEEPLGAPACFNRLAASGDADVIVLLESGARVAPHWLDWLVAALDADPRNGLAGPSTNRVWNEQGVFPNAVGTANEIVRTAQEAAQRFGAQCRTLEPLYSLADFCYAVRREVINDVGSADERYGLGPCWEMDYNVRAARAGWRGVWAGAAYVWRAPLTARRRMEETRRFETGKRLYQDRFCGARLRGEKKDYRPHCRGDECQNFAPADLIQIHRPLPKAPPVVEPATELALPVFSITNPQSAIHNLQSAEPLVSCIMPTFDRRGYVPQSIRNFLRQDYPNLELLILDDGNDPVADCVPQDSRIRYFRLDRKMTIGAKRNLACEQARGEFIVHWDDDDWYPVWRVRTQVNSLGDNAAVCGTSQLYYFDPNTGRAWTYKYGASGATWVAGNTLAYRRDFWAQHRFADIQVGEDSRFVWSAAGSKICDLNNPALCAATVHAGNTSHKQTGGTFWNSCDSEQIRALLGDDWYFYRVAQSSPQEAEWPLVSCIMPTWNRRAFVRMALDSFVRQDYPNRELIIVDDGDDPVGDLAESLPGINYIRLNRRTSIGAKRNTACERAQGRIIAHWDDDDWYSPDRLRYQVMPILSGQADVTGLESAFVLQLPDGQFWTIQPELHRKMFVGDVHGGTLVFRRELLKSGFRYPEINLAEDAWLLNQLLKAGKRLAKLSNPGVFVYARHGGNAWRFNSGGFVDPAGWKQIPAPSLFPPGLFSAYQTAVHEVESQSRAGQASQKIPTLRPLRP